MERTIDTCVEAWSQDAKMAHYLTPQSILKPWRIEEVMATTRKQPTPSLVLSPEFIEQHRRADEPHDAAEARIRFDVQTGRLPPPSPDLNHQSSRHEDQ
ncbi:hypothetical protein [Rhabdochromatium marinum]|uniref:hypothetical protein n=1 Tax=Rhabdochromatium marinum TaxID=48729 RepID=UPI001908C129|nr:hypothetical protein [Rhabdochromatium marinum]